MNAPATFYTRHSQAFLNSSSDRKSNPEIETAHRRSIVKNENAIMNNQKKTEGTSAPHLNSSESQKKESGGKREEKEKTKQRQVSHSAGAGKNR